MEQTFYLARNEATQCLITVGRKMKDDRGQRPASPRGLGLPMLFSRRCRRRQR